MNTYFLIRDELGFPVHDVKSMEEAIEYCSTREGFTYKIAFRPQATPRHC